MPPAPQHRSTTVGERRAASSRFASSMAICATDSVSGLGTNTPGSTASVK